MRKLILMSITCLTVSISLSSCKFNKDGALINMSSINRSIEDCSDNGGLDYIAIKSGSIITDNNKITKMKNIIETVCKNHSVHVMIHTEDYTRYNLKFWTEVWRSI